jgi:hypothetical protein
VRGILPHGKEAKRPSRPPRASGRWRFAGPLSRWERAGVREDKVFRDPGVQWCRLVLVKVPRPSGPGRIGMADRGAPVNDMTWLLDPALREPQGALSPASGAVSRVRVSPGLSTFRTYSRGRSKPRPRALVPESGAAPYPSLLGFPRRRECVCTQLRHGEPVLASIADRNPGDA